MDGVSAKIVLDHQRKQRKGRYDRKVDSHRHQTDDQQSRPTAYISDPCSQILPDGCLSLVLRVLARDPFWLWNLDIWWDLILAYGPTVKR
jgi:hypothetical protein